MDIRKIDINSIQESEFNPRVKLERGSREYTQIMDSILEFGFVEPLVVNSRNMCCIGGHQRLQVLKDLNETEVECVMVDIPEGDKEKALCVALNKISGDWDMEKLAVLLGDEDVATFPTGFLDGEVDLDKYLGHEDAQSEIGGAEQEDSGPDEEGETGDNDPVTKIKIGVYRFSVKASDYYALIDGIRDNGIFEPEEIRKELQRRILNG